MAVDEDHLDYVVEQLSHFGNFSYKKMFGGVGFFRDKVMFAGIMDNVFRMKVDDFNRADYEKYGMEPWQIKGRGSTQPYYEVPESILADKAKLAEWAEKAFLAALNARR